MVSTEEIPHPFYKDATPHDQTPTSPLQADMSLAVGMARANNTSSALFHLERIWPSSPQGQLFDFTNVDFNADFFLDAGNMDFNVRTDSASFANSPSLQSPEDVGNHVVSSIRATNTDLQKETSPDFSDLAILPDPMLQDFGDIGNDGGGGPQSSEGLQSVGAVGQPTQRANEAGDHNVIHKQPSSMSDTPETVKHLFDSHLCNVLSIKDDQTTNPWRIYVWPLADKCPALYHALAAMTYFYMSNSSPQFHASGLKNFRASQHAFAQGDDKTNMSLEASLAGRLALGFAEAWDDQQVSPGIEHVRIAGRLVRDAFDKYQTTRLTGHELDRLNFLIRTWMYKDIMIRLTTSCGRESVDLESMTAYIQLDPLPVEQQLDPLLGCAITLFPLIGRLTDIIKSVRRRTQKHNSPSIISKGAEIRMAIEGWSPSFDPQQSGGLTSHVSDVIQTAEAYRWAALLLLRQAVPELPWAHSIWELAEKVSIYLATTPVTSRTMIVQTFPLMAVGGEAFDEEDRNWVRQRWGSMFHRMPLARLDKCKRVTEEIWRRRDAFEAQCGACPSCGAYRLGSSGISPARDVLTASGMSAGSSKSFQEGSHRCRCGVATRITPRTTNFPDSLAFKKGVDNITRAGNLHYTVRGDLRWLEVLKDWNWQGEFLNCPINDSYTYERW